MPKVGEIVTVRNWTGEWMQVRIRKIGNSPVYGETIEGAMVEDGIAHKSVALPMDHLVEVAHAQSKGHGKWDVTLPDGTVERVKSKKAAKELCEDRGLVFQEVTSSS